jgi:hypothetical protein
MVKAPALMLRDGTVLDVRPAKLGAVRVVGHGPGTVELAVDLLVGSASPPRPASAERPDQAKGQS